MDASDAAGARDDLLDVANADETGPRHGNATCHPGPLSLSGYLRTLAISAASSFAIASPACLLYFADDGLELVADAGDLRGRQLGNRHSAPS